MPDIGPLELVIILVIVLLVFGPKRLPGLGRQLGTGMREFKDSITGKDKDGRRDDDDDDDDAKKAAPALERASGEPEVVAAEAQREEQPASRAES